MRSVIAVLAAFGLCSASGAQKRDNYKLYEAQYELAEIQLMQKSELEQGAQTLNDVQRQSPPEGRRLTVRECARAITALQIRANVDTRLAKDHGGKYPFLVARVKLHQALLGAWERACA